GDQQAGKIPPRMNPGGKRQPDQDRTPSGCVTVECGGGKIGNQQQPQKPHRPARPERQCEPMPPKGTEAGIGRSLQIGRIIGQRHQQCDDDSKRCSEPEQAIVKKYCGALALEARPNEEAGEEEKKRHQKDVLPRTKQIETEPAFAVDDRKSAPEIRRSIERERGSREKIQVGQDGMEREYQEDDKGPQI